MPDFLSLLRKYSLCCAFLTSWVVLNDMHLQLFKAAYPLHLKPPEQWLMSSPLLPYVHYHVLHFFGVEGEVIVLAPFHKSVSLLPEGCFNPTSDLSSYCGIDCNTIHYDTVFVGGHIVIYEQ